MKPRYLIPTLPIVLALTVAAWTQSRSIDNTAGNPTPPLPVAWWIADEPSGEILLDSMDNGYDAEFNADYVSRFPALSPSDAPGSALHITTEGAEGTGISVITIPGLADFPFADGFTVSAWVRIDVSNHFPEGEWFHLAVTYDGNSTALYVNGTATEHIPQTTDHWLLTPSLTTSHVSLVTSGDEATSLDLADVRLYATPLDTEDVEAIFIEAADFIEALADDDATSHTAAIASLRALLGDEDGRAFSQAGIGEVGIPSRPPPLPPNVINVPAQSLFRILTPMEK